MDKFEYKVFEVGKEKGLFKTAPDINVLSGELNKLGSQGWEMVGCTTAAVYEGETRSAIAILKRKI